MHSFIYVVSQEIPSCNMTHDISFVNDMDKAIKVCDALNTCNI